MRSWQACGHGRVTIMRRLGKEIGEWTTNEHFNQTDRGEDEDRALTKGSATKLVVTMKGDSKHRRRCTVEY